MSHAWTSELWLPHASEVLFQYLSDAGNLDGLTPPWLRVQILTPGPIQMASGTRIDYQLRLRGIPIRWQSEITLWDPPARFAERQTRGPFRSWAQLHTFVPRDGGVLVQDALEYEVPGGTIVDRLIVRPDVEKIFAFRAQRLEDAFPRSQGPA